MSIASDEYQTPKKYIKAAIEVMGSIDLDPACSHENAKRLINITNKYTPRLINATIENPQCNLFEYYAEQGLERDWFGNVWLNEPYSKPNLTNWTNRLVNAILDFEIMQCINLVPSYTSESWYHNCIKYSSSICLPNHRIEFLINGKIKSSPRFANTFFYFGNCYYEFMEIFSRFGKCYKN